MALAVDRFELLEREILPILSHGRDLLAVLGTVYVTSKALSLLYELYETFVTYGVSSLRSHDLVNQYGKWAVVTGCTEGIGKAYAQELASNGLNIVVISLGAEDCQRMGNFLVVTGCTEGIGAAYCYELAAQHMNLLLISRTHDKLFGIARSLEESFGIQTVIVPVDFNDGPPAYDKIRAHIENREIGILVNNVGVMYDYPQLFLDVSYEKLWQLVHVNVAAATMMTHLVLPQMVKRHKGAVITVSSGACHLPTPQLTVYAATKQYLKYFMKGLEYEYRSSGVTFQCLSPFYVATRMTRYSSTLSNTNFFIPTATVFARNALSTLGWSKETPGYWPHLLQLWFAKFLPEWLWMWGASRLNSALRRQAHSRLRHRSGQCSSSSE